MPSLYENNAMAGGIAEAYYWKQTGELPIPKYLINYAKNKIQLNTIFQNISDFD